MYLSASVVAVSTKGRYNKCSTFTFTFNGIIYGSLGGGAVARNPCVSWAFLFGLATYAYIKSNDSHKLTFVF